MNHIYRNLLACCLLVALSFLLPVQSFAENGNKVKLFYDGPVEAAKVSGKIKLSASKDAASESDIKLEVKNTGSETADVAAGLIGGKADKVNVASGQKNVLQVAPKVTVSGKAGGALKARIDLAPVFNGLPAGKPVGEVEIDIVLPKGTSLMRTNKPLKKMDNEVYRLSGKGIYLTEVTVVYNAGPVSLDISKSVQPVKIEKPGPVEVTLVVTNVGKEDAKGVILKDNFDPRDFTGVGSEFSSYDGKENDRRLIWTRTIDNIPVGKSVTVKFTLNALRPVHSVSLNAATATTKSGLVGVSNKISLSGKTKKNR